MSPLPYTLGSALCLANAIVWPTFNPNLTGLLLGATALVGAWFCRWLFRWADQ